MNIPASFLDKLPSDAKKILDLVVRHVDPLATKLYLSGGMVRDLLLGREIKDIDFTVSSGSLNLAGQLAKNTHGAFVPLHREEGIGRLVVEKMVVDFCDFRGQAETISEDLGLRDFTINAMAVEVIISSRGWSFGEELIDPCGGMKDLQTKCIRMVHPRVFADDPLRMLRAYRFAQHLNFTIPPDVEQRIQERHSSISSVSMERIAAELDLIMAGKESWKVISGLKMSGLLFELFSELGAGMSITQPASHHLDVLTHNIETLHCLEQILEAPQHLLKGFYPFCLKLLEDEKLRLGLKWAALFHDVGKPAKLAIKNDRPTFYNHDSYGSEIANNIGRRFCWSNKQIDLVCQLIHYHMRPFHLSNVKHKGKLTPRACLRIGRALGEKLPILFVLAMADSMAAQGSEKPSDMEDRLIRLGSAVISTYQERIKPALQNPPLLNGHEIMELFSLQPGPLIGKIHEALIHEQIEHPAMSREEAKIVVDRYLANNRHQKK